MKTAFFWIFMVASALGDKAEKSFYLGDQRFSVKVEGENLARMVWMNPHNPKSINMAVAEVAALIKESVVGFKTQNNIKVLRLQRVSLMRFFTFDDGREVWLWEASYTRDERNGATQQISFFVTAEKKILVPQPVPYSKKN